MSMPLTPPLPASVIVPPGALPDVSRLVTEDDTAVDNFFSEKQQRLLTEPLYASWAGPGNRRTFLAAANVGLFFAVRQPPVVPDAFLSLDVEVPSDWWEKHRAYFLWEFGKAPEVAIEVVSNLEGEELGSKLETFARIAIPYYVVWDPQNLLKRGRLHCYSLRDQKYQPMDRPFFAPVGLGLTLWRGTYEGCETDWLRWCLEDGHLILTGAEQKQRAERLAAKLREMGVEPEAP